MEEPEKTTRELEWFELETKMREVLHTQLEPVLLKAREDRESHQNLKSYCRVLEDRLKSLETTVLGDHKAETIIENIYKKFAEIEGNRKKDVINLTQSFDLLTENVKSFDSQLKTFNELLLLLKKKDEIREKQINNTDYNIEQHKTQVITEINKLNENFKEMNRVYQEVAMKTEEQANIATAKAAANSIEMGNYKREIDAVRKDVVDSLSTIKEVRGLKLNIEVFDIEKDKIYFRFMQLTEEIAKFHDELLKRDSFVDKYIPLQTAILISDYMHNALDHHAKRKLAEFENETLKELNMNALDNREVDTRLKKADQIINSMKHIEERKVELLAEELNVSKRPNFNEIREKLNSKRKSVSVEEAEKPPETPPGLSRQEIEKIVQVSVASHIDAEVGRLKNDLSQKLSGFKKYIKSLSIETNSIQTQFVTEIDNLNNKLKLLKSDFSYELADTKKTYEGVKAEINTLSTVSNSLVHMTVALFEYSQIEQVLQKQDEEDRHNMALNMEKEFQNEVASYSPKVSDAVTLPSANFSFQKKCLSCGTSNSMFSGFRTSIVYHPSPLFYRSRKFDRHELLNMKGQIVKKCWESFSSGLNLKNDENFTEKSEKPSDRASKFSRLSSIDETSQDYKESLPILVSPSIRNKSSQRNKFVSKNNL
jgi:hypothetical protein